MTLLDASNTDHEPPTEAGLAVHRWASQPDPWVRYAVYLTALSPAQQAWLLSLPSASLVKLAAAGPLACGRAARGVRLEDRLPTMGMPDAVPLRMTGLWRSLLADLVRWVLAKLRA